MRDRPDIYEGSVVGWNGYRAAVRELNGNRVHIHYQYDQPERTCQDCQGTGTIVVMRCDALGAFHARIENCQRCRATGRLMARTRQMRRWVDVSELTAAPPKATSDPEGLALAVELMRGRQ